MEPFYFKSYDRVVGEARDLQSLILEMERIGTTDPECVNWHVKQGHISSWLHYIGQHSLAEVIKGARDYREALTRIREIQAHTQSKSRQRRRDIRGK